MGIEGTWSYISGMTNHEIYAPIPNAAQRSSGITPGDVVRFRPLGKKNRVTMLVTRVDPLMGTVGGYEVKMEKGMPVTLPSGAPVIRGDLRGRSVGFFGYEILSHSDLRP